MKKKSKKSREYIAIILFAFCYCLLKIPMFFFDEAFHLLSYMFSKELGIEVLQRICEASVIPAVFLMTLGLIDLIKTFYHPLCQGNFFSIMIQFSNHFPVKNRIITICLQSIFLLLSFAIGQKHYLLCIVLILGTVFIHILQSLCKR